MTMNSETPETPETPEALPLEKQFEFNRIMSEVTHASEEQKTELIRQLLYCYLRQQELFKEIYRTEHL